MELKIFKGFERCEGTYPVEAVQYALAHKEEAIPELLEILEYTLQNAETLVKDDQYIVHFPAIYLLAFFRERSAYGNMIRLGRLPDSLIYTLMGDSITDDYGRILGSVCDGNLEPIKDMIEDPSQDQYIRTEGLQALLVLLNTGMLSREQLVAYFKELFNGKLEADDSYVWEYLPYCCALIQPEDFMDEVLQAVTDGRVTSLLFDKDHFESHLAMTVDEALEELGEDDSLQMISEQDVLMLEEWVATPASNEYGDSETDLDDEDENDDDGYSDDEYSEDEHDEDEDELKQAVPMIRLDFTGRNQPCPCGSGKKYKKCCLGK